MGADIEGDKPKRKKLDTYPIGFFHIDLAEVRTAEGKRLHRKISSHPHRRLNLAVGVGIVSSAKALRWKEW